MERSVLELVFDQTGGPNGAWKSSTNWKNPKANTCTWYGINCDENGSVTSIQLGSNGLKGSIPALQLWTKLPNLVHLKLYGNDVGDDTILLLILTTFLMASKVHEICKHSDWTIPV